MKNFFKGLGKGLLYFAIYFGAQILVSVAAVFLFIFIYMLNNGAGNSANYSDMYNTLMDMTYKNAMLISVLSNILTVLIFWIIFLCRKKKFTKEVDIVKTKPLFIPVIFFAGCAFNIIIAFVLNYIPISEDVMNSYMEQSSLIDQGNAIISFIAGGLIAPIAEEITFRGLIFNRFKSGMPVWLAAVLSSAIFGLMHGNILWASYAFVLGLVLCWFYTATKSLWGSIILHLSFNSFNYGLNWFIEKYVGTTTTTIDMIMFGASIVVMVVCVFLMFKVKNSKCGENEPCEIAE